MTVEYSVIRAARKERNLTQEQLAKKIGVNQSYVAQLENKRVKPSLKTAVRISKTLDIPIEQLVTQVDIPIEIVQIFLNNNITSTTKSS